MPIFTDSIHPKNWLQPLKTNVRLITYSLPHMSTNPANMVKIGPVHSEKIYLNRNKKSEVTLSHYTAHAKTILNERDGLKSHDAVTTP